MEKWIRYYQLVLAGLIGSILAIVIVSLVLSAYQVSQGILKWSDLSSIADFWNGHFGPIALLVIAVGLYIQARQFDSQLHIERQERLVLRREHAYTVLELVEAKITQLGEAVHAYESHQEESGGLTWTEQKGIWSVLDALRRIRRITAEDRELWTDERVLDAYVRGLRVRKEIWDKINALNQELGDEKPLDSFYAHETVISGEDEISWYLSDLRKRREEFVAQLHAQEIGNEIIEALGRMTQDGWRISQNQAAQSWYVSARCFAADKNDEVAVVSEGFVEISAAYSQLTTKWQNEFLI